MLGSITNVEQNSRTLLIDQILDARTKQDVEAAEKAAHEWLGENPDDIRIIAAQERLDETRVKLEDRERRITRISLLAFVATSLIVGFLTLAFSGMWILAAALGPVIGLWVTSEVWQSLYEDDFGTDDREHP